MSLNDKTVHRIGRKRRLPATFLLGQATEMQILDFVKRLHDECIRLSERIVFDKKHPRHLNLVARLRGRTKTTAWNTEGMAWEIPPFRGLELYF
jgi:hypothetical protein